MEVEKLIESGARVDVLPADARMLLQLDAPAGSATPTLRLDT
jgi:hypothetical protein